MARRGAPGEDFSFVSPLVKYLLFFFNLLFWAAGVLSRQKSFLGKTLP